MSSLNKAVLPGYSAYRSIMSHETAIYLDKADVTSAETVGEVKSGPQVIPEIVENAGKPEDLIPLPLDALGIDDAADLDASSDPEDE